MGWFDEQIRQRVKSDQDSFAQAFGDVSSAVLGRSALDAALNDERRRARGAIEEILTWYGIKPIEVPEKITDLNDQLEYQLRPTGIMRRLVTLGEGWYRDASGAMLGHTVEGDPVALIPRRAGGYDFFDWTSGVRVRVTDKTSSRISSEAYCFYRPLPLRKLDVRDLLIYIARSLNAGDVSMIVGATLAATLLGMVLPMINNLIFERIMPSGQIALLVPMALMLLGVRLASAVIDATKNLVLSRIRTTLSVSVQAATMMRVLSLPTDFFKKYSAGELSGRTQSVNRLCELLAEAVMTAGLTSLFSLMYLFQISRYAPALTLPALLITLCSLAFSVIATMVETRVNTNRMALEAKTDGLIFSLFSGVSKIKLAGAEKRAFARWASAYRKSATLQYNPPLIVRLKTAMTIGIPLVGTIVLYYAAARAGVSTSDYMAFNVAYGMAMSAAGIAPIFKLIEPVLAEVPEVAQNKQMVTRISGGMELSNLSFRYRDDMPPVIDNLSLKIRSGQYVAIVGKTGCGKSTLMRLMLGFETPQKGAIYYDGKDLQAMDLRSLRRGIGVVLQSGKLFQGDIFSNITISAPWLTMDDAWAAAEMAGMADDIRHMPMGMHTLISEGAGGISGGQRQRLMIARAIAPKPKILMFDEATSALDNITQKIVSQSLEGLKCTRIVIAHRLSTIRQCDRIVVLDKGRIIEDGTYDQLVKNKGFFAELVARQQLDTPH